MITSVIFDCFGVLTNDGWLPFKQTHFGDDKVRYDEATELNRLLDVGAISYPVFVERMAHLADVSSEVVRQAFESHIANAKLFAFIRTELSGHYRLGILSNAGVDWLSEFFSLEELALFDAVALSFEIRALKPQPKAYETIAEMLACPLEECLLIDDQQGFCEGAERVGMTALHYETLEQTIADLRRQLLPAPNPKRT